MAATEDVVGLYTRRARVYPAYVQAFAHRQGLTAVLGRVARLAPGQRILDAGCGTGLSTLAIVEAYARAGVGRGAIDAFDLTPAMIDAYRATVQRAGLTDVAVERADVLALDAQLSERWTGYDLIVCASMLEYVQRGRLGEALAALRARLAEHGQLVVLLTRSSFVMSRWLWQCEGYTRDEIVAAFRDAGFPRMRFVRYPWSFVWMNVGNHVVVAELVR